ncbi:MAG: deoxyguanosinetriphosphate triphosphohydrolase [Nitrospirae bacterium]|nr:deoxyguanosinetriphosphate triphosphohydrolase [Nitrospirota bacterium]
MTIREQTEQIEAKVLSQRACLSINSKGRQREEQEGEIRTCFQKDRDRIIHAKSFRRLKHKTQVFLAPKGDHYRTRLTHVLEVSQISRTIARALRLNEDLTEAIALGHDLGHTPFGHAGETVLRKIHPGGFDHYVQSLRVVDFIEKNGMGLNLTHEVRDGIIKHSKGKGSILPDNDSTMAETLEGQVVRISDIIAYVNHDLDDALRAEVIQKSDIPVNITEVIGDTHAKRINTMVTDLVYNTIARNHDSLNMSEPVLGAVYKLREFLYERVYESDRLKAEFIKAKHVLESLYGHYLENVDQIMGNIPSETNADKHTIVRDFIACMTDRFALASYDKIFIPERWTDI